MASPTSDTLHQHIFSAIDPMRGSLPSHVIAVISHNIAFLVKSAGGPKVSASQVSISIIDVRGHNNCEIGHKATVSIHLGPGEFKVVVTVQVPWKHNVIVGLTEKVDGIIKSMLDKEGHMGNDGHDVGCMMF